MDNKELNIAAGGHITADTYTYNSQNLLETITDPLGRTIRFSYDPN